MRRALALLLAALWLPLAATAGSLIGVRSGAFDGARRVVLDLRFKPADEPLVSGGSDGWKVELDGRSIPLPVKQGMIPQRRFYVEPGSGRPLRYVIDFAPGGAPVAAVRADDPLPQMALKTPEPVPDPAPVASPIGSPASAPPPPPASRIRLSGYVEAEGRWFPRTSDDGVTNKTFGSFAAEPSLRIDLNDALRFTLTGFGRVETSGTRRSHGDLREAKLEGRLGAVDLTLGVDRRFWGQTEAVHLVDIINQIDTLEDIDAEDKLGQPLVSARWQGDGFSLEAIALPWFRDRRYPNRKDRPNAPLQVVLPSIRDGGSSRWTPDFAVRATLSKGPLDLAVFGFDGLSREPRLLPLSGTALTPVHDRITEIGGDALAVLGPVRLKAEGYYRWNRNDRITSAASWGAFGFGAEYTVAHIFGGMDANILAELYYDSRGRFSDAVFQKDVFAGFRLTGNDIASTELLAGVILDLDQSSKFINVEASRRIGSAFTLLLDVRMPVDVAPADPLKLLADDGFVQLKLRYNF